MSLIISVSFGHWENMSRNIPVAQTAKGEHWSLGKWNNSVFVLTSNLKIVKFIINLYPNALRRLFPTCIILIKPFWLRTKKRNWRNSRTKLKSPNLGLVSSRVPEIPPRQVKTWWFFLQKSALEIRWGWGTGYTAGCVGPHTQGKDQDTFPFGNSDFWEFGQVLNPGHIVLNQTFFCCLCILEDTQV